MAIVKPYVSINGGPFVLTNYKEARIGDTVDVQLWDVTGAILYAADVNYITLSAPNCDWGGIANLVDAGTTLWTEGGATEQFNAPGGPNLQPGAVVGPGPTAPGGAVVHFVPDAEGSSLNKITAVATGDFTYLVIAVRNVDSLVRVPATSETTQDTDDGWSNSLNKDLHKLSYLVTRGDVITGKLAVEMNAGDIVALNASFIDDIASGGTGKHQVPLVDKATGIVGALPPIGVILCDLSGNVGTIVINTVVYIARRGLAKVTGASGLANGDAIYLSRTSGSATKLTDRIANPATAGDESYPIGYVVDQVQSLVFLTDKVDPTEEKIRSTRYAQEVGALQLSGTTAALPTGRLAASTIVTAINETGSATVAKYIYFLKFDTTTARVSCLALATVDDDTYDHKLGVALAIYPDTGEGAFSIAGPGIVNPAIIDVAVTNRDYVYLAKDSSGVQSVTNIAGIQTMFKDRSVGGKFTGKWFKPLGYMEDPVSGEIYLTPESPHTGTIAALYDESDTVIGQPTKVKVNDPFFVTHKADDDLYTAARDGEVAVIDAKVPSSKKADTYEATLYHNELISIDNTNALHLGGEEFGGSTYVFGLPISGTGGTNLEEKIYGYFYLDERYKDGQLLKITVDLVAQNADVAADIELKLERAYLPIGTDIANTGVLAFSASEYDISTTEGVVRIAQSVAPAVGANFVQFRAEFFVPAAFRSEGTQFNASGLLAVRVFRTDADSLADRTAVVTSISISRPYTDVDDFCVLEHQQGPLTIVQAEAAGEAGNAANFDKINPSDVANPVVFWRDSKANNRLIINEHSCGYFVIDPRLPGGTYNVTFKVLVAYEDPAISACRFDLNYGFYAASTAYAAAWPVATLSNALNTAVTAANTFRVGVIDFAAPSVVFLDQALLRYTVMPTSLGTAAVHLLGVYIQVTATTPHYEQYNKAAVTTKPGEVRVSSKFTTAGFINGVLINNGDSIYVDLSKDFRAIEGKTIVLRVGGFFDATAANIASASFDFSFTPITNNTLAEALGSGVSGIFSLANPNVAAALGYAVFCKEFTAEELPFLGDNVKVILGLERTDTETEAFYLTDVSIYSKNINDYEVYGLIDSAEQDDVQFKQLASEIITEVNYSPGNPPLQTRVLASVDSDLIRFSFMAPAAGVTLTAGTEYLIPLAGTDYDHNVHDYPTVLTGSLASGFYISRSMCITEIWGVLLNCAGASLADIDLRLRLVSFGVANQVEVDEDNVGNSLVIRGFLPTDGYIIQGGLSLIAPGNISWRWPLDQVAANYRNVIPTVYLPEDYSTSDRLRLMLLATIKNKSAGDFTDTSMRMDVYARVQYLPHYTKI